MADNVSVVGAANTTIATATDDVGGYHYQRVKLGLGADGSATDAVGGSGTVSAAVQRVVLATDVGLPAGESHVGEVGAPGDVVDVTLSLDTSAYASGDLLADTQSFTGVRVAAGRAVLQSLAVIDEDDQGAAFTLYFLSANNSLGTENAAPSISDTLARDVLGWVDVGTGDYKDLGGVKVACLTGIGLVLEAASASTSLYVAAVNGTGTPTYTASGLRLKLGLLWD